jgi:DNA-binding NarL/FixJ family response regulator
MSTDLTAEEEEILQLIRDNPEGLYINEIAKQLNISRHTVSKRAAVLERTNKIKMRTIGTTRICYAIGGGDGKCR